MTTRDEICAQFPISQEGEEAPEFYQDDWNEYEETGGVVSLDVVTLSICSESSFCMFLVSVYADAPDLDLLVGH